MGKNVPNLDKNVCSRIHLIRPKSRLLFYFFQKLYVICIYEYNDIVFLLNLTHAHSRNIVKINAGIQYSLQSTDLAKNLSLNKLCYLCWYYRQEKVSSQFKIGLDHFLFVWLPKCVPYTRNNKRSFRLFVPFQSSFRVFVPFSTINVPIL